MSITVSVDYDTPEPLPDITKCVIVNAAVDFTTGIVAGLCVQQDVSGAVNGPVVRFELPLDLASLTSLADTLVAALQTAGTLPPGKVVVKT